MKKGYKVIQQNDINYHKDKKGMVGALALCARGALRVLRQEWSVNDFSLIYLFIQYVQVCSVFTRVRQYV